MYIDGGHDQLKNPISSLESERYYGQNEEMEMILTGQAGGRVGHTAVTIHT